MNTMNINRGIKVIASNGFGKDMELHFSFEGLTQDEVNGVMCRLQTGQGGNKIVNERFKKYAAMYNRELIAACKFENRSCDWENFTNLLHGLYKYGRFSNRLSVEAQVVWNYIKHMCGSESATNKLNEDLAEVLDTFCSVAFILASKARTDMNDNAGVQ